MNTKRLPWIVVLTVLLATLPTFAGAARLVVPCAPGTDYNPACDADHDGDVDVIDIQLTAGHFNQTGVWTSDNDHNHLGQSWGSGYPLVFSGGYVSPDPNGPSAPLILSNSGLGGSGLWVESVRETGVLVSSADVSGVEVISAGVAGMSVTDAGVVGVSVINSGGDGVSVSSANGAGYSVFSAGADGVFVGTAGTPSQTAFTYDKNGFEVSGAEDNGLYVGRADQNGVRVLSANEDGVLVDFANRHGYEVTTSGNDGVHVQSAGSHGLYVEQAGLDGVEIVQTTGDGFRIGTAGADGVYINAAGEYAGYFNGSVFATQYLGAQIVEFAVNSSAVTLKPGTLVSPIGMKNTEFTNAVNVIQVIPADGSRPAIGVALGRAEPRIKNLGDEDEPQLITRLVGTEDAIGSGEYMSVLVFGKTKLQASAETGPITAGSRVAIDGFTGAVRSLRLVEVDGVQLAESAPTVGIALEDLSDGSRPIWVLVNPH